VPTCKYPDLIDEPQLFNAARCYLARFPIDPKRPDPFHSDWYLWEEAIRLRITGSLGWLKSKLLFRSYKKPPVTQEIEKQTLGPRMLRKLPKTHIGWLDESTFNQLSSHHPLLSPSTDLSSAFVQHTLELLALNRTTVCMHTGTAEWFYQPAINFCREATRAGIEVILAEDLGGYHVEGCVMPPDFGGPAARLQSRLIEFLCRTR